MDGRFCEGNHQHRQIAGSCVFQGERLALSRFAAFYPRVFARVAAKSILRETHKSTVPIMEEADLFEIFPAESEENPAKRPRIEPPREAQRKAEPSDPEKVLLTDQSWDELFAWMQSNLPKSGSVSVSTSEWPGNFLTRHCSFQVKQILAGKGMDKYLVGETSNEMRKTICQCRKTKQGHDLGEENWTKQTLRQQRRKAMPSHIMNDMHVWQPGARRASGSIRETP